MEREDRPCYNEERRQTLLRGRKRTDFVKLEKEDRHCCDVERRQTFLRGRKRTDQIKLEKEDRLYTMEKEDRPC